MGNFLSSKKKGPVITDTDKAILTLKTQKRKLEDEEKLINLRIERHTEVARALLTEKRRDRALLALQRKKLTEKQLTQLHAHIVNVESMLLNIESTKHTNNVMAVLHRGNEALKQLQAQVRLEDVQKLREETAEAAAYQQELAALLGQELNAAEGAEVEAELCALEDLVLDEEKLAMPTAPVPTAAQAAAAAAAAAAKAAASAAQQEQQEAEAPPTAAAAGEPRRAEPMLAS